MTTVLIVDDSPTEVHVLTKMLEGAGYTVESQPDGEKGIARVKEQKPDVVLMDVVMPGLNGFQATRMLSRDPDTADVPVIIVTTKDQETDMAWGLRQGAKHYLVKPVAANELLAKVKEVLG